MATWLSQRIAAARQQAGALAGDLADSAGIDRSVYSRIESGEIESPSFENVARIARALGVEVSVFDELSTSDKPLAAQNYIQVRRALAKTRDQLQKAIEAIDGVTS